MSWETFFCWIEDHPGLASWVQALGSVLAIAVAIWLAGSERRHRARVEKKANKNAIVRAIAAGMYSKKVAENNVEFFGCSNFPRRDLPRFISAVNAALARIDTESTGPGIDSEIQGHLHEVANALVDIRSLVEQCMGSPDPYSTPPINYLCDSVERIDKAIKGLHSVRR